MKLWSSTESAEESSGESLVGTVGSVSLKLSNSSVSLSNSPKHLVSKLRPAQPENKKVVPPSLRRRGDEWLSHARCSLDPVPKTMRSLGLDAAESPSGFNRSIVVETICATNRCSVETLDQIDRDLPRTYPDVDFFANTDVREALGLVLQAVAIEFPDVGYVQGMNFLGANILLHTGGNEDRSFQLFRYLMENPKYRLRHVFQADLPNLRRFSDIMESFIGKRHPDLFRHFGRIGLEPLFYSQNWIMTLFSYMVPFEPLAHIWDRFFQHGWPAIFRVSLAIMQVHKESLLSADFERSAQILRNAAENPAPHLLHVADTLVLTIEETNLIADAVEMKPIQVPSLHLLSLEEDLDSSFEDASTICTEVDTPLSSVISDRRKSISSQRQSFGFSSLAFFASQGNESAHFVQAQSLAFGESSDDHAAPYVVSEEM